MRLTNILLKNITCKYRFVKGIPGNIWIGKHRFVPPVTRTVRRDMWKKMMFEEEVMMYLKNPYVTEEQEKLYLEQNAKPQELERKFIKVDPPFVPLEDRTVAFHLGQLNLGRKWDKHEYEEE